MNKKADNEQPLHDRDIAYSEQFIDHKDSADDATEIQREEKLINLNETNISHNWLCEIH